MRKQLLKLVRVRKHLLRSGRSMKNVTLMQQNVTIVERWLNAYPKASDEAALKFAKRNYEAVCSLIPGGNSTLKEYFNKTLITNLNTI